MLDSKGVSHSLCASRMRALSAPGLLEVEAEAGQLL